MSLTQSTLAGPPISKERIQKAKKDFHHKVINATTSTRFIHDFIDAMDNIEMWDFLVGTVILNSNREDLLEFLGEHYNKKDKKCFDHINVVFSDDLCETEVFLVSQTNDLKNIEWTDGWVTSSMQVLTKEEVIIKDIIT